MIVLQYKNFQTKIRK